MNVNHNSATTSNNASASTTSDSRRGRHTPQESFSPASFESTRPASPEQQPRPENAESSQSGAASGTNTDPGLSEARFARNAANNRRRRRTAQISVQPFNDFRTDRFEPIDSRGLPERRDATAAPATLVPPESRRRQGETRIQNTTLWESDKGAVGLTFFANKKA